MEKAPSIQRPSTEPQAPHRQKLRLLAKTLLILSFLAPVYLLIRGGGSSIACSAPTVLRGYWDPERCSHTQQPLQQPPSPGQDEFRLVSIHRAGVGKHRNQVYQVLDIPADSSIHSLSPFPNHRQTYTISSTTHKSTHLTDRSRENTLNYISHTRLSTQALCDNNPLAPVVAPFSAAWTTEDVVSPNISDMNAILTLAKVASNAYIRVPDTEDWYDLGRKWNESTHFGWEENGLRGHVFANTDNSTIIMAMKGTSPPFVGGSDTSTNDKVNDNILFSCCCARVSYVWTTVCDCYTGKTYKCNLTCLENEVASEEHYYNTALHIYFNVTAQYPNANLWLTGHSLGGSLASLMGLTFGVPTVTFEAVPERLASRRLHLPAPPALKPEDMLIWHYGHTADPVFMGVCTGPSSTCWYGGYAMESTCHTGMECVYDTVTDFGWRVSLGNHRIKPVVSDVLERYNTTANCTVIEDCVDCYQWDWVD